MIRLTGIVFGVWLCVGSPSLATAQVALPETRAERTKYRETTTSTEVIAFCEALAKQFPERVNYRSYGTSHEGQPLALLTFGEPAPGARRKPVLFAFANIHAGEVDGKEGLLMLSREFAAKQNPLCEKFTILLAPNINPDGDNKRSPENRKDQNGPSGVGSRENTQKLDLNRDFVKLESPEIRALVALIHSTDPLVVIDCHTTNGSKHRYKLTYDGPRYPAADADLIELANSKLLTDVTTRLKTATGFDSYQYGNFNTDKTKWETYPAAPRFGVQYFGVCNRFGILSESYSYATFEERVTASREFVRGVFGYTADNLPAMIAAQSAARKLPKRLAFRGKVVPSAATHKILGFDGDTPKEIELTPVTRMESTLEVELPAAYILPATQISAVHTLMRHGVVVRELREDLERDVEAYTVRERREEPRAFQGHKIVLLEVQRANATRQIPAGSFVVSLNQPLGRLAAYLLEPQAEDGLAAWNVFDDSIKLGAEYPVLRLPIGGGMLLGDPQKLPEKMLKNQPFTLSFLQGGPGAIRGGSADDGTWDADGEHLFQSKESQLWRVHARTGRAMLAYDAAKVAQSLRGVLKTQPDGGRRQLAGVWNNANTDRTMTIIEQKNAICVAYFDGRPAKVLAKGTTPIEFPSFTGDGKRIVAVRGNNLIAIDIETDTVKQLTTDGGEVIFNGRADWVYEEEIFNRSGQTYWYNPARDAIAFLRLDDTPVKKFTIADAFPVLGGVEQYSYPKPGYPNPTVKLGVSMLDGSPPTFVSLDGYTPDDTLIARVGWFPDGKRVFAYVSNRRQTWLDFVVWDTPSSAPKKLFRDSTEAWIDDPGAPVFLADGSFLFFSERTGYKHLYRYAADGALMNAVTSGEWEARAVHRVDLEKNVAYIDGTKDASNGLDFYRITLDGQTIERLSTSREASTTNTKLAPKGDLFISRVTDSATPSRAVLKSLAGEVVRQMDTNPVYEREEYQFGKYERFQINAKDGFAMEAAIVYPPDFDPTKRYPIWISTYAGPHAPTVKEAWSWRGTEQVIAHSGIISLRVDPRSASGKGAKSAWACYKQMGVQELADLIDVVGWLGKQPWADTARVGLEGHSYGGYMTAYAMTHSKLFAAGIAGAPVTDWTLYDSIYTERYMGTPADNPKGYEKSSVLKAAKNLHGKLLLIHGLVDDNVHFQNSAQFMHELQSANKPFELMIYPRSRHGIISPHYTPTRIAFIRRALGVTGS